MWGVFSHLLDQVSASDKTFGVIKEGVLESL